MNQPTFFRLPLLFVLSYLLIMMGNLILNIYPQVSNHGETISLWNYLSPVLGHHFIQMTGQFALVSLFFYHTRITLLNRKSVLGVIGLAIFLYAVNYALAMLKITVIRSVLQDYGPDKFDFSLLIKLVSLADLLIYLVSFLVLYLAVRTAADRYIKNTQSFLLTAETSPVIYGVLFSAGMMYLMWLISLCAFSMMPGDLLNVSPKMLTQNALSVAANLIISGGIIFLCVRKCFPAKESTLRIRTLTVSVISSVILSIVLMIVVAAIFIFIVVNSNSYQSTDMLENGFFVCVAVSAVLILWLSRKVIRFVFRT